MSKKKLLAIILPCVAVLLVAVFLIVYFCCFYGDIYSKLNKIANKKYENLKIKVVTEQDGFELTSSFDIKNTGNKSVINYSVQNFAPIGSDTAASDNDTVTSVGKVVLQGNKVVEQTGDKVDISFSNVTKLTLYFYESNFSGVKNENGLFSAKVTAPQRFMDAPSLVCTDMTVTFAYQNSAEYVIVIHYQSEGGASVTLTYTFS